MNRNFSFLERDFPVLANFGALAEDYCYSDANSCLMKLGMIGETIVNLMFTYDRIPLPMDNTAVRRIDTLYREGLLTQDLVDILHALRKVRNKAVHENYSSVSDAKALLPMAHSLCEWFMQTYGDWSYQHQEFVMPVPQEQKQPTDKAAEEQVETRLTQEAEAKAAQAETIPKDRRRRQPASASGRRRRPDSSSISSCGRLDGKQILKICVIPREPVLPRAGIWPLPSGLRTPAWATGGGLTMPCSSV